MKLDRPNIDRPMVSLFFEIKRLLPYDARASMKIAAPDVADRLIDIHQASSDLALRALIEKFFNRAGHQWSVKLKPTKRDLLSLYRNQNVA